MGHESRGLGWTHLPNSLPFTSQLSSSLPWGLIFSTDQEYRVSAPAFIPTAVRTKHGRIPLGSLPLQLMELLWTLPWPPFPLFLLSLPWPPQRSQGRASIWLQISGCLVITGPSPKTTCFYHANSLSSYFFLEASFKTWHQMSPSQRIWSSPSQREKNLLEALSSMRTCNHHS